MPYKPILERDQLPPSGQRFPEHLHLDIKGQVPPPILNREVSLEDLACDIAAFANSDGGVILVGAHEQPRGTLREYVPMSQEGALRVVDLYQDARDLCSPRPVINPRPIEREAAAFVVAVNVDPYIAPPIGVQRKEERGDPKWWAFPARRGDENRNLYPEELATIMEPRLRRVVLQLARIPSPPPNGPQAMLHFTNNFWRQCWLRQIDREALSMRVQNVGGNHQQVIVPLEAVTMVWREPSEERYHVAIAGELREENDGWHFQPPRHWT